MTLRSKTLISYYFFIFGSNASLNPSPNRLKERMIKLIRTAGKITRYGYVVIPFNATEVREPRLAIGAETPIHRKLKKASVKIADGI